MPSRNLEPGQYQLGDFVFGAGTQFNVEEFEVAGWEVNVQDSQAQLSDELRFGSDSFRPNPIQIAMTASRNRVLSNVTALLKNPVDMNFENDRHIGDFTREWRADEIRKNWGALKPLYVCRPDGHTVMVYGRPGKLAVSREFPHSLTRKIVAEFRRSDTLAYNEFEWFVQARAGEKPLVLRSSRLKQGDAPSWVRLLLVGPMTRPIINIGDITVELDHELEAGEIVEISSYPWQRRVVRLNDGLNLAAKLVRPYLEHIAFDVDKPYEFSWNATDVNTQKEERSFGDYSNTAEGLPSADWYPTVYSSGTGQYKVLNGRLVWEDDGNQDRLGVSVFKLPTMTSYQLVGFTAATPSEIGPLMEDATHRILGCVKDSAASEYLFWEIGPTEFWFGYHKDGVDQRLSEKYKLDGLMNVLRYILRDSLFGELFGSVDDWKYEAEFGTGAGTVSSTLRINDVHTYTFTASDVSFGVSGNTLAGLGMKATNRVLGQSTPGEVSDFWVRDNQIEPINVSGVYLFWRDVWQNI